MVQRPKGAKPNVFKLGWVKRGNCGKVTKIYERLKEIKKYFN